MTREGASPVTTKSPPVTPWSSPMTSRGNHLKSSHPVLLFWRDMVLVLPFPELLLPSDR